jgi:predicted O-methyltransferase YrrM
VGVSSEAPTLFIAYVRSEGRIMKSRATRNDVFTVAAGSATAAIASVFAWKVLGAPAVVLSLILCLAIALWAQFESMRRTSEQLAEMRKNAFDDFRQIESLLSLFATLKPELPLPPLRDHAMSPDLVRCAVELMLRTEPHLVVELGSGASTVFLGYCLKRIGRGRLLSIDHEPEFSDKTRTMIEHHGLSEFVTVVCSPLEPLRIGAEEYSWYSIRPADIDGPIDLVIVDGPPYHVHPLARYPALPVLLPRMSSNSSVILDDADRPEELRIIERWKFEFPQLSMQMLQTEKGGLLIERSAPGPADSLAGKVGEDKRAAHSGARVKLG